jgi:hypothetical protein
MHVCVCVCARAYIDVWIVVLEDYVGNILKRAADIMLENLDGIADAL